MNRKTKYSKYDLSIKAAIAMTGRLDLFPEMKIPRMTALYWLRKGFVTDDPFLAPLIEEIQKQF